MTSNKPVIGCEDLFPHVSVIDSPGHPHHGEVVCSPRVMGLLIAPSVEEFTAFWDEHGERVTDGMRGGRMDYPKHWTRWARRRSNELAARYNSLDVFEIIRGLHRDYDLLPTGGEL